MSNKYTQSVAISGKTRFTRAPMGEIEFSRFTNQVTHLTTFNGGDIVPIYCREILPNDTIECDMDFVIRQTTSTVPVMGQLMVDYYAFFVPNRIVNKSWKNVMGENTSGAWVAPEVSLAPLGTGVTDVTVPVGSVADYYGFPTQAPIRKEHLALMNDLKFRGYLECYNQWFRSQDYQPAVPYSKLNIFNGFFYSPSHTLYQGEGSTGIRPSGGSDSGGTSATNGILSGRVPDTSGAYGSSSVAKEYFGDGYSAYDNATLGSAINLQQRKIGFSMLGAPLKANKLHDYFTSVLPSPQKGRRVVIPLSGQIPLNTSGLYNFDNSQKLKMSFDGNLPGGMFNRVLNIDASNNVVAMGKNNTVPALSEDLLMNPAVSVKGTNLVADLKNSGVSLSVDDMRLSASLQQVYEILGRGGSRYHEFINSFFGLQVDNPFNDIPELLGHFRRDLDLYQTAQTSATSTGDGTPQGNLTAFGYTANGGKFFQKTFIEHGYIHIFAVVRHRNVYSTYLSPDNFRLSMLDFYSYPLANISEQPVYTRIINPFSSDTDGVFGYNPAWEEYRFEPDRVSGQMRSMPDSSQSLDVWNYVDNYDPDLTFADGEWLKSNTEEVVRRSTALTEREYPQFKGQFIFKMTIQRAMPVYSVPGLDIF